MKFIKYIICTTALFASTAIMAQQDPNRTFFKNHMNLINPAHAGSTETTNVGVNFRSQWIGVSGAPETQTIFVSRPLKNNLGIGLSIINDQTFIEKQTNVNIDFSYKLQLNEKTKVYLGVKAGLNSYNANTAGLLTYGSSSQDPSLAEFNGGFKPNVGAGAFLKGEKFFVSLSSPNLLTTDRLEEENGLAKLGSSRTHIYLGGGYDIDINETLIFKPSMLLRYVSNAPISLDIVATLGINKRIELGGSYRLNEGLGGVFIFKADHWVDLGYAYQTASDAPLQVTNNGTHEVSLIFKL